MCMHIIVFVHNSSMPTQYSFSANLRSCLPDSYIVQMLSAGGEGLTCMIIMPTVLPRLLKFSTAVLLQANCKILFRGR